LVLGGLLVENTNNGIGFIVLGRLLVENTNNGEDF
jgi:hypothetical protein